MEAFPIEKRAGYWISCLFRKFLLSLGDEVHIIEKNWLKTAIPF